MATSIEGLKRGDVVQAVRRASEVEAILASMTEGLLIVDAASRIVSLNPPARAMFGLAGAGIILGPLTSSETAAVAPVARQAGVAVLAFTNDPNQAQPGVYSVDGDKLRLCWGEIGKARPKKLTTKRGDQWTVHLYEKKKE